MCSNFSRCTHVPWTWRVQRSVFLEPHFWLDTFDVRSGYLEGFSGFEVGTRQILVRKSNMSISKQLVDVHYIVWVRFNTNTIIEKKNKNLKKKFSFVGLLSELWPRDCKTGNSHLLQMLSIPTKCMHYCFENICSRLLEVQKVNES